MSVVFSYNPLSYKSIRPEKLKFKNKVTKRNAFAKKEKEGSLTGIKPCLLCFTHIVHVSNCYLKVCAEGGLVKLVLP